MSELTETELKELVFHSLSNEKIEIDESEFIFKKRIDPLQNLLRESICGIDQRQKVIATEQMPYMAICKLYLKAKNGSTYVGSGWLVGANRLFTAGHCVFDKESGGWFDSITVIPGKSGLSEPYGRYTAIEVLATRGWIENDSVRYDMGAIKLDKNVSHNNFITPENNDSNFGEVCGYPGDRDNGLFQYKMSDSLAKFNGRFFYEADTFGGQSGGVILKNRSVGIGIHNYGGCPNKASDLYTEFINGVANW